MAIHVEITLTGAAALGKRAINDITRNAMRELGLLWRRRYLPKHFTVKGGREYKFRPRKNYSQSSRKRESYVARKKRQYGHSRPLEFTGEGKRLAFASKTVQATAAAGHARVVIPLPSKFNFRNRFSQIRMADEIRAVSDRDRRELEAFLVKTISRGMNDAGAAGGSATVTLN